MTNTMTVMPVYQLFTSDFCKSTIKYQINDHIACIDHINIDYDNMKSFVHLLRKSIDTLDSKGITTIQQYVSPHDWDSFLKNETTFEIVERLDDSILVTCPIGTCLENMGKGMGILG